MGPAAHDIGAAHHDEIIGALRCARDRLGHREFADARAACPERVAHRYAVIVVAGERNAGSASCRN